MYFLSSCRIFITCCIYLSYYVHETDARELYVTVSSPAGTYTGIADDNRQVIRFLGIPYAVPPTGDLRFKRPVPVGKLKDEYNATYHRPHCPQTVAMNPSVKYFQVNEDCLHLNVYVPGTRVLKTNQYAVMIWIYGGRFHFGGADIYSGDVLSAENGVIVVTLNYRLNVFGFLSDGSESMGNLGLWDQKLAIQWVKRNIASFGGDVNRVTIFGQSAGGASVMFQALNPSNAGLFSRVIAQSGSSLAWWALQTDPAKLFRSYAKRLWCYKQRTAETLDCLRNKTMQELLSAVTSLDTFAPSVDMDFIKEHPVISFSNSTEYSREALGHFASLDFLSGIASQDGAMAVTSLWAKIMSTMGDDISTGVSRGFFDSLFLPRTLTTSFSCSNNVSSQLLAAVNHEYTDWVHPNDPLIIRDNMLDMSTDIFFLVPAVQAVNQHYKAVKSAGTGPSLKRTYFYEFDYKPFFDPNPTWLRGAKHGMEIPYVFGLVESFKVLIGLDPEAPFPVPVVDQQLAEVVMKMWTNFAKSGSPNSPKPVPYVEHSWPEYSSNTGWYMHLSANQTDVTCSAQRHLAASRVAFWTKLVPVLEPCHGDSDTNINSESSCITVGLFLTTICFLLTSLQNI